MIKSIYGLLVCWVICSGVPRQHWFIVLTSVFYFDLLQYNGLFVVMDRMMKR